MVQKTLFELVNEVQDEASFIAFLNVLSKDRQVHPNEWKNDTIELFLEASADWGQESIHGLTHYIKPDNAWKRCAQIMYMGKIYE